MLAYHVEWHMIEAWRALRFAGEDRRAKHHRDLVAAARRSAKAERLALAHTLDNGSPAHSLRTLLEALSTIVRKSRRTPDTAAGAPTFTIVTRPNQTQQRALQMLATIRV